MQFKLIAFDFDGTLADTGQWFLKILDELADEFHFKRLDPHDHAMVRAFHARDVLKHLQVPLWKMPQIMRRTRQYSARDADTLALFPGIDQMLRGLKQNEHLLAVVSSNAEENIRRVLRENANLIDHYRCGATLLGKERKLKQLLKTARVSAQNTIYIGDELRDITAAREVGIRCGAVAWGYTDSTALAAASPEFLFKDVADILHFVGSPYKTP